MKLPQIPPRDFVRKYLTDKKIEEDTLREYLYDNVLMKFMEALGSQDQEAMRQVAEKTFADKIVSEMASLKGNNLRYTKAGELKPDSVYLLDKLFLKGVSADRSINGTNFDYVVVSQNEQVGLKQYVHKFNLGFQRYYFLKEFGKSILGRMNGAEEKKDPKAFYYRERSIRDAYNKQRRDMLEKDFGLLLRVTMQLTDGALGQVKAAGNSMSETYTGNHIAIFECELKHPPLLSMGDHDYFSYIMASRINFKNWRLVDLDNFMKGNQPYSDFVTQVDWDRMVDEYDGPKAVVEEKITTTREMDTLKGMVDSYVEHLQTREPNSNAEMPFVYAEREALEREAAVKLKAE